MTVQEFYSAVGGDYKSALARMMNDAFITKMLGKFLANNSYATLEEAYKNKDPKAMFEAAHSLKGVTGNLALDDLHNKSCIIVEAVRNYESVQELNLDAEMKALESSFLLLKSKLEELL